MNWPEAIFGAVAIVATMAFFIVLARQPTGRHEPPMRREPSMPIWTYNRPVYEPKDDKEDSDAPAP